MSRWSPSSLFYILYIMSVTAGWQIDSRVSLVLGTLLVLLLNQPHDLLAAEPGPGAGLAKAHHEAENQTVGLALVVRPLLAVQVPPPGLVRLQLLMPHVGTGDGSILLGGLVNEHQLVGVRDVEDGHSMCLLPKPRRGLAQVLVMDAIVLQVGGVLDGRMHPRQLQVQLLLAQGPHQLRQQGLDILAALQGLESLLVLVVLEAQLGPGQQHVVVVGQTQHRPFDTLHVLGPVLLQGRVELPQLRLVHLQIPGVHLPELVLPLAGVQALAVGHVVGHEGGQGGLGRRGQGDQVVP